jgi:hypothetical protein
MNPPFHPPSVCPSTNLSPFHQPHTETSQWGPHPSSVSHDHSSLLGACIFYTGAPVSVFVHFFPKLFIIYYLLYKHLYLQSVHSLSSPLATCFFWPYATHVTLGLEQYLSFTLADIVHIFRVPRRSVTSTL